MMRQFRNDAAHRPDEHAGVPGKIPLGEKLLGQLRRGFFAELLHFVHRRAVIEAGNERAPSALDVAVARAGPRRLDANGDKRARAARDFHRPAQAVLESGAVFNKLIRGQHHHRGFGIARGDPADAQRDGRRRVALVRLGEDILRRHLIAEQRADGRFLLTVGENEDVLAQHEAVEPGERLLQQGLFAQELEKLFGAVIAAQRPETAATAAGEDNGVGCTHGRKVGAQCKRRGH